MYRFERHAPFDLTAYADPGQDRSGPPLTQGGIFLLISTIASEHCTPEMLDVLDEIDPDKWYHGQLLETMLNNFEDQDQALVIDVGKNIYYSMEAQFRAVGIEKPEDVITTIPMIWLYATRGNGGEWRSRITGDKTAIVEMEQPYNCMFEQGAMKGALECFDARDVQIDHSKCIRNGAAFCELHLSWK
ncbi:hypothetical protein [Herpetosiphon sp. NSE202]|uniref:hypothetical protein n=1 Tax=Herpetosiphon sp. NSE202 TaxID=3351349 RepID=UPI003638C444